MTDATVPAEPLKILKPYTPDPDKPGRKLRRRLFVAALLLFCWFWGVAFAFMAPYLLLFFAFPMAVLIALCIWALPEETPPPLKALNWLFFAYLLGKVLWPDYLAIGLGVLPWITIARLTAAPLTLLFLISLSVSRGFRGELQAVLRSSGVVVWLLVAFVAVQILTLPLSSQIAFSVDRLYNDLVNWAVMFFVGCWVFSKPGRSERWASIFWLMTIPVAVIAGLEFVKEKILWAGHIPGFLKIEDPSVQLMLAGVSRAYTGRYRSIATFTTPLGLSEYFALATPFAIHTLLNEYPTMLRRAAVVAVPLIMAGVWFTNARLGSIGFLISVALYGLIWALHQRRWRPRKIFPALVAYSYPVMFALVLAATIVVGHLRRVVWGGGETAASTEGRKAQIEAALPMIGHNPIGHGAGMGAMTLGFREPSGLLTIDSYFLSILLEYGVVGFLLYYGMFAVGAGGAIRASMASPPERRELSLLMPAGVSLVVYVVIKSVFSEELNNTFGFIILGMVCALLYRVRAEAPARAPVLEPVARRVRAQAAIQGARPRRLRRPETQPANP